MSTESATRDVEWPRIPEVSSTTNIAALSASTSWSTRRWRAGTSARTSQHSRMATGLLTT